MVSPNSSTDDASSDSMEEKENRFYNKEIPIHQNRHTSSSESESESESNEGSPRVVASPPQKKPQPIPTNRNVATTPKPSTKRPREEEQSRGPEKNKKPKEVKKAPILEVPKQSDKKPSEEKKRVKKSESPTKSTKKNGQVWTTQDEISFLKGFVEYQTSKGLPKTNMTPVYDYIRNLNLLEHEYTNMRMYDKLRRLKIKYNGLKDKITDGDFTFKNPHDEIIYKLGRKLWGSGEEEEEESADEEDEKNGVEEDEKKRKGVDVKMGHKQNEEEEEEDEDEDDAIAKEGNLASNGAQKQSKQSNSKEKRKPSSVSEVALNNGSAMGAGKLIDLLHKKNLAMMNEIKDDVAREKQEIKKEIMEMVEEALRSSVNTGTGGSVQFSSEEMIKRISSLRELPKLEKVEADRLEHKWQRQHLIELDVSSKHLQLLQEECQLRIEKLRSVVEEKNP